MLRLKQKGFTIVELLVVIVVIAILVALTLPNLFSLQERARDDERKNDLKNIQTALEAYYSDNNAYPAATSDLETDYIDSVPTDPDDDSAYTYTATPSGCTTAADDCTDYTLQATLENTNDPDIKSGTTDTYELTAINE